MLLNLLPIAPLVFIVPNQFHFALRLSDYWFTVRRANHVVQPSPPAFQLSDDRFIIRTLFAASH